MYWISDAEITFFLDPPIPEKIGSAIFEGWQCFIARGSNFSGPELFQIAENLYCIMDFLNKKTRESCFRLIHKVR